MESIRLEKGQIHLMEDILVIEGDNAIGRKRRNIVIGLLLLFLIAGYFYSQYDGYVQDPHQFSWFRFILRVIIIVVLIIPKAINWIFRFSAVNEIPYSAINKHVEAGSFFKRNSSMIIYLSDNKMRTISFTGDEMNRFKSLLYQKLGSKI